jgi:hypothetical protein
MAHVLSRTNKGLQSSRKPRTRKHIVKPLTAEQISKGVGVTRKDAALVRKVLLDLGYLKPKSAPRAKTSGRKKAPAAKKTSRVKKAAGVKKSSAR